MLTWLAAATFSLLAVASPSPPQAAAPSIPPGLTPEVEAQFKGWVHGLHEMGVVVEGDSVRINQESRRAATDSAVRRIVYPESYTWEAAMILMKAMRLKVAFWHLINLYETDTAHRDLVLQTLYAYDGLLDMERALVGAFYTYGFLDPRVCVLRDGRPEIVHPDVSETRLRTVRELVGRIKEYRKHKPVKPAEASDGVPSGGER